MDQKNHLGPIPNGDTAKSPVTKITVSDDNGHVVDISEQKPHLGSTLTAPSYHGSTPSQSYLGSTPPQAFRRRCDSVTANEDGDQNESKVLVIYTGGTIGMIRNDDNSKRIFMSGDKRAR